MAEAVSCNVAAVVVIVVVQWFYTWTTSFEQTLKTKVGIEMMRDIQRASRFVRFSVQQYRVPFIFQNGT